MRRKHRDPISEIFFRILDNMLDAFDPTVPADVLMNIEYKVVVKDHILIRGKKCHYVLRETHRYVGSGLTFLKETERMWVPA